MFPSSSSFLSPEPGSAWWAARVGGDTAVCSATGDTFVRTLQRTIGVQQDGVWGDGTSRALATALLARGAPSSLVSGVNADAAARSIGTPSLLAAVWLFHRTARGPVPGNLATSDLLLPSGVQAPRWGQSSPRPQNGDTGSIACSMLTVPGGGHVPWSQTGGLTVPPGVELEKQQTGSSAPWPLVLTIGATAVATIALAVWLTPRKNPARRTTRRKRSA